ncbi:uncharacterized protein LOC107846212 [Capsicum annuum]|uniref:uncharacterized protein LOC107846212 n=1 Tax=Capsicum annuum TaxID=4072 RepID=UPI0007BF2968|nr:uncharacterized protein LOC107846212 [Capsicum annuum]
MTSSGSRSSGLPNESSSTAEEDFGVGTENYSLWYRSMKIALLGRNNLGIVDGAWKKERFHEKYWYQWERCNAIVLSWLMNSVSLNLVSGIAYASDAHAVWTELKERFDKVDGSRSFNLHREIATLVQGASSISVYFSKLKDLWNEVEALVPLPSCNCNKSKHFLDHVQRQKLYQFLMGLNDSYIQARSQILLMTPLPTINQAYSMLMSDESQKGLTTTSGILGTSPAMPTGNYEATTLYNSRPNNVQKFKKQYTIQCDFCKMKGHTKDNCYKIVGYIMIGSKRRLEGSMLVLVHLKDSFLVLIKVPFFFIRDKYDQIVTMLNNMPHATPIANTAGMNTILGSVNHQKEWIIDTGATNHMVEDPDLLTSLTKLDSNKSKKVFLPTSDAAYVTHVAQDLFNGKVKGIGRQEHGLYLLPSFSIKSVHAANSCSLKSKDSLVDVNLWHIRLGHSSFKFIAYVKRQFNKCVKVIRSDNGTEFINSVCDSVFKSKGIIHQTSCAYNPQQNGVAERKHKHILEVCRAIRLQGYIPLKFWGHCVLAAAYLINRMPTPVLKDKSPFEILYGRKPSLEHLRVLGCLVFAKNVHETDKLKARAIKAIHMGYFPTQKGYILYDLAHDVFFVNKDVEFRETIFPFQEITTKSTPFLDAFSNNLLAVESSQFISSEQPPEQVPGLDVSMTVDVTQTTTTSSTHPQPFTEQRRSTRSKAPPLWLKDFITAKKSTTTPTYGLSNYISYDHLSTNYQAFIASNSVEVEPTSYADTIKDPR